MYPTKEHTGTLNQSITIKADGVLFAQICRWGKHNQFITCVRYPILIPPFYLFDANLRPSHQSGSLLQT